MIHTAAPVGDMLLVTFRSFHPDSNVACAEMIVPGVGGVKPWDLGRARPRRFARPRRPKYEDEF
jgi:hypothetical protein